MYLLGLTGSIGMGKSFAARAFARMGVPVHDADAEVHRLMAPAGAAVGPLARAFPEACRGRAGRRFIDREALGQRVFADPDALARLEALLHPLVRRRERAFLARAARRGHRLVVLEVPLLFETGADARCDGVCVVWAPRAVQRARVLRRPSMTLARLAAIRSRQMTEARKRRRADFVVATGDGPLETLRHIRRIVRMTSRRRGRKWPGGWE